MCHHHNKFNVDSSLIPRPSRSHDSVFQHVKETSRPIQEKESKHTQVSSAFTPKLHPIPQQVLANI